MRNLALAIGVFIVVLVALSFGEKITSELFIWLSHITGIAMHQLQDLTLVMQRYVQANWGKVLIALALTVPISLWISRQSQQGEPSDRIHKKRKIAIFLAVFLGWLGIHRFYLGQIGWGLVYIVIFYLFAPLIVLISWIDALRYVLMSDEDFALRL